MEYECEKIQNMVNKVISHAGMSIMEGRGIMEETIEESDMKVFLQTIDNTDSLSTTTKEKYDDLNKLTLKSKYIVKGKILVYDYENVYDYQIKENSIINVCQRVIKIKVEYIDKRTYVIEVSKNDKIVDLEREIQKRFRFNEDEHRLEYHGSELKSNDSRVSDYNISEGSVIKVVERLRNDESFYIEMTEKRIIIDAMKNDRISNIKTKTDERLGLISDSHRLVYKGSSLLRINILIRYFDLILWKRICIGLEILSSDRIVDVKWKIYLKLEIQPSEIILIFHGCDLEDAKTISEYDITEGSILYLIADINITVIKGGGGHPPKLTAVTPKGLNIPLDIDFNDTIQNLRRLIGEKIDVEANKIILTRGIINVLKDDTKTLTEYDITQPCYIYVCWKITISLLTYNMETVPLEILNSDKIFVVKRKIEEKIGLPVEEQILMHQEKTVRNDDVVVDKYNIIEKNDIVVTALLRDLKQEHRGICLLINNESFNGKYKTRKGTNLDEYNIVQTFESMGYEVQKHQNVASHRMNKIIKETKDKIQGKDKMFITFILSHGEQQSIITSDEQKYAFKDIWTPFTNKNCTKLIGKPKLFFFACCRGTATNTAIEVSDSDVQYDGPRGASSVHPSVGDIFLGFATCEDFRSIRITTEGTLYIKVLCRVIKEHMLWSISDIHQEVQSRISKNDIVEGERQVPCCENMLTDHAYFI